MKLHRHAIGAILLPFLPFFSLSQDKPGDATNFPTDIPAFLKTVDGRATSLNQQMDLQTTKYLSKLDQLETKLRSKIARYDSAAAGKLAPNNYSDWISRMQSASSLQTASVYVPHIDSLQTTLKFLQSSSVWKKVGADSALLSAVSSKVQALQARMNNSAQISQYIGQRNQQLAAWLAKYPNLSGSVTKLFTQFKTTGYYYRQQVQEIKSICNDPKQIEQKALAKLSTLPAYQSFMAKHSMLASLFRLPDDYGSNASAAGYQTRDQVQGQIQQKSGGAAGGSGAAGGGGAGTILQQQVQQAHDQIAKLQQQAAKYGIGGPDLDMPDFTPNQQKTKTFLKRLTYGASLQLAQSTNYYPATGNVALSLGYKINDKSTAGVGLSYNMGLGEDWGHMHLSSQGIGLRSFLDWKIKKSYYVMGGFEENYLTAFSGVAQLKNWNNWQPSALIGVEKKYRISSKLQGTIQLLFDALYRQELPPGQPVKFRVGYNF